VGDLRGQFDTDLQHFRHISVSYVGPCTSFGTLTLLVGVCRVKTLANNVEATFELSCNSRGVFWPRRRRCQQLLLLLRTSVLTSRYVSNAVGDSQRRSERSQSNSTDLLSAV